MYWGKVSMVEIVFNIGLLIPKLKALASKGLLFIPLVAIFVIVSANAGPINNVGLLATSPQLSPSLLICAILNGSVARSPAGV